MMRIERMTSPLPRECSTTELHGPSAVRNPMPRPDPSSGAGEGNRTLVVSLEGFCSAIELHPPRSLTQKCNTDKRRLSIGPAPPFSLRFTGGGGWIRTNVGARPTDLQSAPFSRSGTPPAEPEIMSYFRQLGKTKAPVSSPLGRFRSRSGSERPTRAAPRGR